MKPRWVVVRESPSGDGQAQSIVLETDDEELAKWAFRAAARHSVGRLRTVRLKDRQAASH